MIGGRATPLEEKLEKKLGTYFIIGLTLIIAALNFVPDSVLKHLPAFIKAAAEDNKFLISCIATLLCFLVRPIMTADRHLKQIPVLTETISALTYVDVRRHDNIKVLSEYIQRSGLQWSHIYLGICVKELTAELVGLVKQTPTHCLYIHPRLLSDINIQEVDLASARIYVSDCPRETCYVIGGASSDKTKATHAMILRSEHSAVTATKPCWSATIRADSDYAKYLERTYRTYYQDNSPVLVDSTARARFIYNLYKTRCEEDDELCNEFFHFPDWHKEYAFAAPLLKSATSCILAVDFMRPRHWLRHDLSSLRDPMSIYICAHETNKSNLAEKVRVHIFKESDLNKARTAGLPSYEDIKKEYTEYVKLHSRVGFRLLLCSKSAVRGAHLTGGFVIIDDSVVFYEKTDRHKPTATIDNPAVFTRKVIDQYKSQFNYIKSRAIDPDDFFRTYLY